MTATFDPFTPAGVPEQHGHTGIGPDGHRAPQRHWPPNAQQSAPPPSTQLTWTDEHHWAGSPAGNSPQTRGARTTYSAPADPYAVAEEDPTIATYPPSGGEPGFEDGARGSRGGSLRRVARVKPLIVAVVVVLLLVAAFQTVRLEGVNHGNAQLAAELSAQQGRTDQLAKQLAGLFDPEAVSSGVLPSVFRVRAGDFTGTAFSIGDRAADGQANLLTNYHVVAEVWSVGSRQVSLERGSARIDATIVKVNKDKDLALLHADQRIRGLSPASKQVRPGQQVVVVGAPLGLDDTVTTGVISAYRPADPDGPTIQFDAPINPGNSGGPVVNGTEQVVGLATAKAKGAEGIGLAIPIKTACETFAVC